MQNTSALYRQILAEERHWFETSVVIGDSGTLVTELGDQVLFGGTAIVVARSGPESGFSETQIFSVRTDINMFGESPEIGTAVAQEVEVTMLKPAGDIPPMAQIIPYVRVCGYLPISGTADIVNDNLVLHNATIVGDRIVLGDEAYIDANDYLVFPGVRYEYAESEWIQQGIFFIDTREITNNDDNLDLITLHGFDAILKAEQDYATTELDWPAVDVDIVHEIARKMGVSVDPRTDELMTSGYELPLPTGYSLREYLSYIAAKYIGNFIMSDIGELRLVSLLELPEDTRLLITEYGDYIIFGEDRLRV